MLISVEMQQEALFADFSSALLFETPEEIYGRVFRELRPKTPAPAVEVSYRKFANVHSSIRMEGGRIYVRISDILEGAPAPVTEALAYILLGKMLRKPVARNYSHRYKLYLNRKDIRRQMHLMRQARGRKMLSEPKGKFFDLEEIFERLNQQFFDGLLGRPALGWSLRRSRTMLGHFDPSHNAIILSRIFDEAGIPAVAVEYVMFHEMLHLRHPVEHRGARRCVHTPEFKQAEKKYPRLKEAKEALKRLS
jgi:SprT-like family